MPGDDWDWAGGTAEPVDDFDWAGEDAPRPMEYVAPSVQETSERDRFDRWRMTEQPAAEGADVGTGANVGSDTVPENYRETGRRELVLPEIDISVDPSGQRPDIVRERGQATEIREIEKDPEYLDQRRRNMLATIRRNQAERDASRPPDMPATPLDLPRVLERVISNTDVGLDDVGGRDLSLTPRTVMRTAREVDEVSEDPQREMGASDVLNLLFPSVDTEEPIVGRDSRDVAGMHGFTDAASFGMNDEIQGAAYGEDAERAYEQRRNRAREQAPGTYEAGHLAGTLPLALIPGNQASALARVRTAGGVGFGTGLLRGAGESEAEDLEGIALDALREGGTEGLLSAGASSLAEGAVPALARIGQWAEDSVPGMRQQANQAALEARGIWGRPALEAARERPGGIDTLVRDLDAANAPHNPRSMPEFIDNMLAREGERVGDISREMDETGQRVDTGPIIDRLEALAREQEQLPWTGTQASNAIRERGIRPLMELPTPDFGGTPDVAPQIGFGPAHQQRRELDRVINWRNSDPAMASLEGQRVPMRRALSDSMQGAADEAGRGEAWRSANEGYAFASELDDIARGVERNGVQGGMAGAQSRAEGFGRMLHGPDLGTRIRGAAEASFGPPAAQELRYMLPGLQRRGLEAMIPRLQAMGPRLRNAARTLATASRRGQNALAAAHYMLSRRDPEYRAAVQQIEEQQQEQE